MGYGVCSLPGHVVVGNQGGGEDTTTQIEPPGASLPDPMWGFVFEPFLAHLVVETSGGECLHTPKEPSFVGRCGRTPSEPF